MSLDCADSLVPFLQERITALLEELAKKDAQLSAIEELVEKLKEEFAVLETQCCKTCGKWGEVSKIGPAYRVCETWGAATTEEVNCSFWRARESSKV